MDPSLNVNTGRVPRVQQVVRPWGQGRRLAD